MNGSRILWCVNTKALARYQNILLGEQRHMGVGNFPTLTTITPPSTPRYDIFIAILTEINKISLVCLRNARTKTDGRTDGQNCLQNCMMSYDNLKDSDRGLRQPDALDTRASTTLYFFLRSETFVCMVFVTAISELLTSNGRSKCRSLRIILPRSKL